MENLVHRIKTELDKTTISLREYIGVLHNEGRFVIPDYQRGYVWGQARTDNTQDSVSYLLHTLTDAYEKSQTQDNVNVFLQGITVHGKPDSYDIYLVDGQQRTTFFFLLLKYLQYPEPLKIQYEIREESNTFLSKLDIADVVVDDDEKFQDIYFFKKTLITFESILNDYDKVSFREFVLDHVKFLFVIIPEEQAKIVFTMMNGNKAKMTNEELIKAELLRRASFCHEYIKEAEHAVVRGRLAREWDSWLHWWNREDVVDFFRTNHTQLGWLLPLISKSNKVTFREFQEKVLNKDAGHGVQQSKSIFKTMRLLQKKIEDAYNNEKIYNYIGLILYIRNNSEQRFAFLRWFFNIDRDEQNSKSLAELERYFNWAIIGVNHEDIRDVNIQDYNAKRQLFRDKLSSNLLFKSDYEVAYRWLVRQNIKQDNQCGGRRFDFSIERSRSLEHIYPKSKIGHKNDEGVELDYDDNKLDAKHLAEIKLWREDIVWIDAEQVEHHGSEHSIGNLVLLYKRDNSKFNDADFKKKNEYFFTDQGDEAFKSRHLIHTTMIFSDVKWENWNKEQIAHHKHQEMSEFDSDYPTL